MKKFILKATALTIGALVGLSASATINLTDTTADAVTYATELVGNGATLSDANLATVGKLGFGLSNGAQRFFRFDLTNAKWGSTVVPGRLDTGVCPAGTTFVPSVAIASGGATTDSFVIFQVTAEQSYSSTDCFSLALQTIGVKVTSVGLPVTLQYQMFDTAPAASNNDPAGRLATATETIAKFGKALSFAVTAGKSVASVEEGFKKFTTTGSPSATLASLGAVDNTVATTFKADGTAVVNADLIAAGTAIVVTGDFSAKNNATSVFLDNNNSCATTGTAASVNTANTIATITTGAGSTVGNICYKVNGTTVLPEQTITAAYSVVAAAASTTTDVAAVTLGTVTHDGTTLQAPFVSINPNFVSRFSLNSTYSAAAPWTATILTEGGATCGAGGVLTGSVPANGSVAIQATSLCPTLSAGNRFAVLFNIAAPRNQIQGTYTVSDKASSSSPATYVLVSPGSN